MYKLCLIDSLFIISHLSHFVNTFFEIFQTFFDSRLMCPSLRQLVYSTTLSCCCQYFFSIFVVFGDFVVLYCRILHSLMHFHFSTLLYIQKFHLRQNIILAENICSKFIHKINETYLHLIHTRDKYILYDI